MVKFFGKCSDGLLENAEIKYHIAHRALSLELVLRKRDLDAPTMSMEVFAFAVVIGEEMSRIKSSFRFQAVHAVSCQIDYYRFGIL